mmetsp:Transcript_13888/g.46340  ORF Transcript_13888/g.46340 Transcript_13888/m.46340 type:complete len:200 (-) Transcript_13888:598-1197(-)
MDATPRVPSLCFSAVQSAPMMRAPLMPMGWPSETAPPNTLTRAESSSRSFAFAKATTLKASLISWTSTSFKAHSAMASAAGTASAGAMVKSAGARCASPKPRMAASGTRPRLFARRSDIKTRAAAPSLSDDALTAVTVPPVARNAGRAEASFAASNLAGSSSRDTNVEGLPRPPGISTGEISSACTDFAADARLYDSAA